MPKGIKGFQKGHKMLNGAHIHLEDLKSFKLLLIWKNKSQLNS